MNARAWQAGSTALRSVGGDPDASRVVYGTVIALVVLGVLLLVLALWLLRSTRVDRALLAPLESMSDRKWRKMDPASQRRLLDEERPPGARPLHVPTPVPDVDEEFEAGTPAVAGFEDLQKEGDESAAAADETGDEGDADLDDTDAMPMNHDPDEFADAVSTDDSTEAGEVIDEDPGAEDDARVEEVADADVEDEEAAVAEDAADDSVDVDDAEEDAPPDPESDQDVEMSDLGEPQAASVGESSVVER